MAAVLTRGTPENCPVDNCPGVGGPGQSGDMDEIRVRTQDELCRLWESYLGERRPDLRSLLLAYLDVNDRPTPVLAVDDVPEQPEPVTLGNLMELCEGIVSDNHGGGVALLLVGPGPPP